MNDNAMMCPVNGCDLQGDPIPEEYRQKGYYGPPETASTHYSNLIGYEVRGVYDGVAYWGCPMCGGTWHRFPESDPRRDRLARAGVVIP